MLGSKKSGFNSSGSTTLISRGTTIIGDVHFSGTLEIEGLVQGNIIASPDQKSSVRVTQEGRVEGDIRAPSIVINGTIEGDVHSSKYLELASKSNIQGNVYYTLVEMAAGSEVNGSLKHTVEPVVREVVDTGTKVSELVPEVPIFGKSGTGKSSKSNS